MTMDVIAVVVIGMSACFILEEFLVEAWNRHPGAVVLWIFSGFMLVGVNVYAGFAYIFGVAGIRLHDAFEHWMDLES